MPFACNLGAQKSSNSLPQEDTYVKGAFHETSQPIRPAYYDRLHSSGYKPMSSVLGMHRSLSQSRDWENSIEDSSTRSHRCRRALQRLQEMRASLPAKSYPIHLSSSAGWLIADHAPRLWTIARRFANKTKANFWLDVILLCVFVLVTITSHAGEELHAISGCTLIAIAVVHRKWIVAYVRRY